MREERFERRHLALRAIRLEAARGAHELVQVLDAAFAAAAARALVALVMLDEAARLQHVVDLLVQGELRDLVGEPLDERHEAAHRGRSLAGPSDSSLRRAAAASRIEAAARPSRALADDVDALRADAARRQG